MLRNSLLLAVFFRRSMTFSVASEDSMDPEVIMFIMRRSVPTCFNVSSSSRSSSRRVPLRWNVQWEANGEDVGYQMRSSEWRCG